MNITLIGMAGAGKSYVGARLAEKLNYDMFDVDRALEKKYGKPLQQILEEVGEERFIKLETQTAITQKTGEKGMVIAPGGSIIYSEQAMRHLKTISIVVYLRVSFETIERRIADVPRAIVGMGMATLRQLYDQRALLYERAADVIVDADDDVEKVIDAIQAQLSAFMPVASATGR